MKITDAARSYLWFNAFTSNSLREEWGVGEFGDRGLVPMQPGLFCPASHSPDARWHLLISRAQSLSREKGKAV